MGTSESKAQNPWRVPSPGLELKRSEEVSVYCQRHMDHTDNKRSSIDAPPRQADDGSGAMYQSQRG